MFPIFLIGSEIRWHKTGKGGMTMPEFKGFSPETVDFLWGIRLNNNREWFMEHKKDYTNTLY